MNALALPAAMEILAVALGGTFGCVARFLTSYYASAWFGTTFPWGTLIVNVIGSLVIGFVATTALAKPGLIDPNLRFFLISGFAGGFTTFSALAFETFALYQKGEPMLAFANLGGNLLLGFIAVVVGVMLAKLL
ncbi:fluoride efflux transporter CrcB [Candidatus Obscuribacterales bacterium]|nr:fluoride efflux transporter CrcB [Candidatus Obscuribacterales bacterium]MBX3151205.1 fluoride efflux transporter CrcB [Candidatus Obscuribacterales bacterium]